MASTLPLPNEAGSPTAITPIVPQIKAALGPRVAAYSIDLILCFSVIVVNGLIFRMVFVIPPTPSTEPTALWLSFGVGLKFFVCFAFIITMGPVYFALLESSGWQATFGKRLLGVYVAGDDFNRVSLVRSSGRWLARFFCGLFGGSFVSIVLIPTNENRKALHDLLAHTMVLKGRPATGSQLGIWRPIVAFGFAQLVLFTMDVLIVLSVRRA